jgi:hypothetical protein
MLINNLLTIRGYNLSIEERVLLLLERTGKKL